MPPTPPAPPPPGRRERKKRETRKRIFSAALQLFAEKGFEATTVGEIAERADVGKGTIFNYFPQKTAFLVAAYSEWVEVIRENLGPVESWQGPIKAQLSRLFDFLVDLAVKNRALSRQIIFENMRQTHLRILERTEEDNPDPEALRLLEGMVREVIQKGQAAAQIRADADETQAASLIAAAAFHTITRGQVQNTTALEIKTALAEKLDIIFAGLDP
jgi:AcrR family transcriptional regulator